MAPVTGLTRFHTNSQTWNRVFRCCGKHHAVRENRLRLIRLVHNHRLLMEDANAEPWNSLPCEPLTLPVKGYFSPTEEIYGETPEAQRERSHRRFEQRQAAAKRRKLYTWPEDRAPGPMASLPALTQQEMAIRRRDVEDRIKKTVELTNAQKVLKEFRNAMIMKDRP